MKTKTLLSLLALTSALITPYAVNAQEADSGTAGQFQIRGRIIGVIPHEGDGSVNIGGEAEVKDAITPEVDFTYFFTDHIAAELIAATAQHAVDYNETSRLGTVWIIPPTLTVQYHFQPEKVVSPYLGAGVNYSYFYGEDTGKGFNDLQIDGGFGFAVQAGVDYWLDENWGVNLDMKKIWLDIDAEVNGDTVNADVDLDPILIGAGVSYRF